MAELTPRASTTATARAATPSAPAPGAAADALSAPPLPSIAQVSRPFFTSAEIKHLLSQTIPDSQKLVYSQKKHLVFQFTFQLVRLLKFPLRVLATAMNYYQRYFLFNRMEDPDAPASASGTTAELAVQAAERDPFVIAMACLLLAAKNEDCIKKLKDIQLAARQTRGPAFDTEPHAAAAAKAAAALAAAAAAAALALNLAAAGDAAAPGAAGAASASAAASAASTTALLDIQRRAVMAIEFHLLQAIKFDFLNGATPLVDVLATAFCKRLALDYTNTLHVWLVCFDIMLTPLCLMIPPHCIALAAIIVTLNVKPSGVAHKYNRAEPPALADRLGQILDLIDCRRQFGCPEALVNEGIVYILDFYVHNMPLLILNEYLPPVDPRTGKERVFTYMDLKLRFNDLKGMDQLLCLEPEILRQDKYLMPWDYTVGAKGCVRFMLGDKRKRFDAEMPRDKRPPAPAPPGAPARAAKAQRTA